MTQPLLKVEKPKKGEKYHVAWARNPCVWNCSSVNEELRTVELSNKNRSKKITGVKWEDLRHTRANEQLNKH